MALLKRREPAYGATSSTPLPAIEFQAPGDHLKAQQLKFTMPALSGMAVAYAGFGPGADGKVVDHSHATFVEYAPSGTPWKIGNTWVVLLHDTPAGDKTAGYFDGIVVLLLCDSGVTPTVGQLAYIQPMATATEGGMVTNSASGNDLIGKFIEGDDGNVNITDPQGLPAGKWSYVWLNQ
jgi:hypothetical protein